MAFCRTFAAACALLVVSLSAHAARFTAVVTNVVDGDTIWVRPDVGGPTRPVRLEGIDAPEICQEFGVRARDALAAMVLRKRVVVTGDSLDENRRIVAGILLGGQDVGEWMVVRGYAWSYQFRRNPGPYAREERRARLARVGLWAQADPMRPREFRVQHGSCRRP